MTPPLRDVVRKLLLHKKCILKTYPCPAVRETMEELGVALEAADKEDARIQAELELRWEGLKEKWKADAESADCHQ